MNATSCLAPKHGSSLQRSGRGYLKPLMGYIVLPGLSLGILLGALVIVSAWVLLYVYVRWANSSYDKKITQLMRE